MTNARELANLVGGTLTNLTSGTDNVALGDEALEAVTSGANNVGVGKDALTANTTASNNTAVGTSAASSNVTGTDITAIGYQALEDATSGQYNTALGARAAANLTSGDFNTAIGRDTLAGVVTGDRNVAIGNAALAATTSGASNTAIGDNALVANTTATTNTAVGANTLQANTTGGPNTAVGKGAMASNTTGSEGAAFGMESLVSLTTGNQNSAFGNKSGYSLTTGTVNTFLGEAAGYSITTGSKNVVIGRYTGNQGGLDLRTSDNNIVLSDGDGNPRVWVKDGYFKASNNNTFDQAAQNRHEVNQGTNGEDSFVVANSANSTPFGLWVRYTGAAPNNTGNYFFLCGDSSANRLYVYSNGNVVNTNNSYAAISDIKLKENIVDSGSQWDDIKALTVRKYSMKEDNLDSPNKLGVIAQEVEASGMGGLVFESPDLDPDTKEDLGTVTKQVNYSILYMKAVKALQEAMVRIETLETEVAALKG